MRRMLAATAALAVLTAASPAFALTIGYVDTAKVILSYQGAKAAQGQMQKELIAYQTAFAERQKKIMEAQKAGKSAAEIEKMTKAYEQELAPLKQKAMGLEQRLSADVKGKIEAVIHRVAAARKLDIVLDKAAVLHGGVDVTNDVIKGLK